MHARRFLITVVVIIAAMSVGPPSARAHPIDSKIEQLSQNFRKSVAQAIRENVARQPQLSAVNVQPLVAESEAAVAVPSPTEISNELVAANIPDDAEQKQQKAELEAEQAKNAHYSFDTSIKDTINDHSQTRQETRDGLAVHGSYSYSDGFFQRTVHYTADEGGYRVTKEEIMPIGDGPVYNPAGTADVSSSLTGSYSITADDFRTSSSTTEAATTTVGAASA